MERLAIIFDFDGTLSVTASAWKELHYYLGTVEGMKRNEEAFLNGEFENLLGEHEWATRDFNLWLNAELPNKEWVREHLPPFHNVNRDLFVKFDNIISKYVEAEYYIVSGGVDQFIRDFVAIHRLPITDIVAHHIKLDNNRKIKGIIEGAQGEYIYRDKADMVRYLQSTYQYNKDQIIGVGNGSNDINMFKECGWTIAINPRNDRVIKASDEHIYTLDFAHVMSMIGGYILSQERIE